MELKMTAKEKEKVRASRIQRFLKFGREDAAWNLFLKLQEKQLATTPHYNIMLRGCSDSKTTKEMMDTMVSQGLDVDVYTHAVYISKLIIEGDIEAVREYVDTHISPNNIADKKLENIIERAVSGDTASCDTKAAHIRA